MERDIQVLPAEAGWSRPYHTLLWACKEHSGHEIPTRPRHLREAAAGVSNGAATLAAGFKQSKFRPQGREGILEKLQGFCQVLEEAVEIANKDLERLILAQQLMNRVADKCRSNSSLPELVDLFLSRPLVTVPLGAKLLKVTPKAVDLMLMQLGGALPRELTGRRRYRAWGIV